MNIILVVFDTLRRDSVGVYGHPAWGEVQVPNFQAFAAQSLVMTRAYPNVLPTLPARIALYSGHQYYPFRRGDIRLKGDFVGAAGWGPIPEEWPTLAETLSAAGYRTGLISDVLHMFKPSKNFWRGFDQWTFLRGRRCEKGEQKLPHAARPECPVSEIAVIADCQPEHSYVVHAGTEYEGSPGDTDPKHSRDRHHVDQGERDDVRPMNALVFWNDAGAPGPRE